MKIVLGVDPIRAPLTGIGRYTLELARALESHPDIDDLCFLQGHRLTSVLPAADARHITSGWRALRVPSVLLRNRALVSGYQRFHDVRCRRRLRGLGDALFHGPGFYLPPFPGRSVVTIHDLSIFKWPEHHPPERVRHLRRGMEQSLRRAHTLVTDSGFTRREVAEFFSWPLARVRSVALASSPDFRPRSAAELQPALSRYRLQPGGYAFFSGTIEPRKNLRVLLAAWQALPAALRQRWPLVVCGHAGWRSDAIHARLRQAEREGWLRYLGYVPAADLPLLFAGARLFLFPSIYEGFGLPVLEAMASGVPVVCSNAASLPEVTGGAALMCAPDDAGQLGELIRRGLEDPAWRQAAVVLGLKQAAGFSWRRCADETVNVYRDVMQEAT